MVCQEARRGVDCSRTSIASKDDSFEADNSPWQTTARAASPPRPSLYFTHVPGASRDKSLYWGRRSEPVSYVVRRSRYTSKAQQVPQLTNSKRYCLSLRNKLQHISPTSHSHHCTSARVPMIRRSEKKKKNWLAPLKQSQDTMGCPKAMVVHKRSTVVSTGDRWQAL